MRIASPSVTQLKQKRIILRLDLNVPLIAGKIDDDYKLRTALPIIRELRRTGAIVVISHLGEPKPAGDYQFFPTLSLKPVAAYLKKKLGNKFSFVVFKSWDDLRTRSAALKTGEVMMIENLRFWKGEIKNNRSFARQLADLGDVYINDAFAVSHRNHASVSAIKAFLPSFAGPLLIEEVKRLENIRRGRRPLVMVFGGAKIASKLPLIRAFLKKASAILVGGDLANELAENRHGLPVKKVIVPPAGKGRLKDIDPATAVVFARIIASARTVFWNGPMGIFEQSSERAGTKKIISAIAVAKKQGAFTMAGGGETIAAIRTLRKVGAFSALSTGGGASLAFLAGEPMPGLTDIVYS